MNGRELILYILSNNLENEPVFKDGKFIGFMTVSQAAAKMKVGEATIRTWAEIGWIKSYDFDGVTYIPADAERPNLIGEMKGTEK